MYGKPVILAGDRGRSKKWREILKLPPVAQCLGLRDEIGKDGSMNVVD